MESERDLRPSMGFSSEHIVRTPSNNSGGANAGLVADMTIVVTNSFSELVWSPHQGPSLTCTHSSLSERKLSSFRGAGSSNKVPLITESSLVQPVEVGKENNEGATVSKSPHIEVAIQMSTSNNEKKTGNIGYKLQTSPMLQESALCTSLQVRDVIDIKGEDPPSASHRQTVACGGRMNYLHLQDQEGGGLLNSRIFRINEPKSGIGQVQLLPFDCNKVLQPGLESFSNRGKGKRLTEEGRSKPKAPLLKLESTAENELVLDNEIINNAFNEIKALESTLEFRNCSQHVSDALIKEAIPLRTMGYERKERRHSVSVKGAKERNSNGDGSSESIKSSNSACFSVTGKRRRIVEQQSVVSKRIKGQEENSLPSMSFVKQDSSFMNWISNMFNGLSNSNQVVASSLALAVTHSNNADESKDKNQDMKCKTGFQNMFQSLCRPNTRGEYAQGATSRNVQSRMKEVPEELEHAKQATASENVTRVSHGKSSRFPVKNVFPHEKLSFSKHGDGSWSSSQLLKSSINVIQENCNTNCRKLSNIACTLSKGGSSSHSLSGIRKSNNTGNMDTDSSAKEKSSSPHSLSGKRKSNNAGNMDTDSSAKEISSSSHSLSGKRKSKNAGNMDTDSSAKEKPLCNVNSSIIRHGSLWITRLTSKSSSYKDCGIRENTTVCARPFHCSSLENRNFKVQDWSSKILSDVSKASPECPPDTEQLSRLKRIKRLESTNIENVLNPNLPPSMLKSSEDIALIIGRKLDGLKHIVDLAETSNTTRRTDFCFFCGRIGHVIQDCSNITEHELEILLRNFQADDRPQEAPALCIKCFRLNHWAISCPSSSERGHKMECSPSLAKNCNASKMHTSTEKANHSKLLRSKERLQVSGTDAFCSSSAKFDARCSQDQQMTGIITSDRAFSTLDKGKLIASSYRNPTSFCSYASQQISEVPPTTLDAINKLRLSRTEILKWMKSNDSLLPLDGFFLRLRLGKWEEGLGGTGYYVSCLSGTGEQTNVATNSSVKDPIYVDVGGVKCLVECQYISNNDFLEGSLASTKIMLAYSFCCISESNAI